MSKFVQSCACVCYLLWPTSCLKELQTSMAAEESEGSEFSSEKQR